VARAACVKLRRVGRQSNVGNPWRQSRLERYRRAQSQHRTAQPRHPPVVGTERLNSSGTTRCSFRSSRWEVRVDSSLFSPAVRPQAQLHVLEDLELRDASFADLELEAIACLPDGFECDGSSRCGAKRLASSHNLEVWWFDTAGLLIVRSLESRAGMRFVVDRLSNRIVKLLALRYRLERVA
ncbi:MAG: hypothetical protein HC933_10095, partial [Pleurocapsa sp. SU_196_0]|nr:hypothetical protein [Pleurocapsa sp. SU_196_0]